MKFMVALALAGTGVIHLLPAVGLLGSAQVSALYGVSIEDPNLEILLRHRAVLFGLVGTLLVAAAFRPSLQPVALLVGLASVSSFLLLAYSVGRYNELIGRVVAIDIVALALLLIAAGAGVYDYLHRHASMAMDIR